ncbi:serralysin [Octadecabacter temperatus]|uniref:Serralysin B n=1 Tax=Octadecabacter temperatus TaxID=1458307 RepID=A0A0K0YA87_9RHOB|nr:M10 family metallopeptidase C-terminal domain-containing protein [Octadecabacter temperatus]AKS47840.1 Serralysin B precursor [Octadecabacter temperatus]SIO48279.1 serralysin [Octadecabacter temperatus]
MCIICEIQRQPVETDYTNNKLCNASNNEPLQAVVSEDPDASEDTLTGFEMIVGDTFNGTISDGTDEDWIAIELTAGVNYQFTMTGNTLSDTYLRLRDGSGDILRENDDFGGTFNSQISYVATETGTFFVEADAYSTYTGTYSLTITEQAAPDFASTQELADYLLEGDRGYEISFDTSSSNVITVNLSGLTADGQQLAQWAMEAWEMVANIDFQIVTSGEMITLDDEDSGAFAYYPNSGSTSILYGDNTDGVELNVETDWLVYSGTTIDSYSFQTYVHEFGHALGLGHQGDYNGSAIFGTSNLFANDSWQMSVMSYFNQTENTNTDASYGYTAGAMMVDILAIQELYGEPDANSVTAGDTTYGANSTLGNYLDDVFQVYMSGVPTTDVTGNDMVFTIYDRDGVDLLDFSTLGSSVDARIDMNDGTFSDFGLSIGIMGIAESTIIENAALGAGDDVVTGNAADNVIHGGAGEDILDGEVGDDTLDGGAGADELNGGTGTDTASYHSAVSRIIVDLQNSAINVGDAIGDAFDSIEMFVASRYGDQLRGDSNANDFSGGNASDRLYGRAGDDILDGEFGADALYGNSGADTMTGGEGDVRDRFIFFQLSDSGVGEGNRDIITDYQVGIDRIEVSRLDADLTTGGRQDFDFIGENNFSGTAGEMIQRTVGLNTLIEADVDGDGASDFSIELVGQLVLTSDDFLF